MADNYVDAGLMLLRRELDPQAGTECLLQLLLNMREHPTVITRARYITRWPSGPVRDRLADRTFSDYAGSATADHISPAIIQADLDQLEAAERYRVFAERTRAHRTPVQGIDAKGLNLAELHATLENVRAVIAKYYALLTQGIIDRWEAVPQFSTIEPFTRPWVEDRAAVQRAIGEESRRR